MTSFSWECCLSGALTLEDLERSYVAVTQTHQTRHCLLAAVKGHTETDSGSAPVSCKLEAFILLLPG